jgi:hypothetical protein
MNNFYLYEYHNKVQTLTTATPTIFFQYCIGKLIRKPKLIGVWKFKKMKQN